MERGYDARGDYSRAEDDSLGGGGSSQGRHKFNNSILREYDIRGVVGETIDAADAHALGRAFGTVVAESGGYRV